MKRIVIGCALAATLAVPAAAPAAKPSKDDKQNAAQQCKGQRAEMGTAAFRELYGTNKTKRHALGKCVSKFARDEMKERKAAKSNAAKDCKAAQEADEEAFNAEYGSGKKGKNAYGKCVSQTAKQNKEAADAEDEEQDAETVKAAKACRAEQKEDGDAFREEYGTNRNKRNAFGKCVSAQAKAQNDDGADDDEADEEQS